MSEPPEPPSPPAILASDAEREQTVTGLRGAVADGRLTLEEFTERVGLAHAARTDQELAALARDLPAQAPAPAAPIPAPARHRALCSHLARSGSWDLPERSSWRSILGTIDLDLRQARLAAPEIDLEIYNLFGTVTVIVPEGVDVSVSGGGLFASQKIESPPATPIPGAAKLRIELAGPGGTLHVRTRPTLKSAIRGAIKG